jgi:arginyl-tRNA synthetase
VTGRDERENRMEQISPIREIEVELKKCIEKYYSIVIDNRSILLDLPPNPDLGHLGFGCYPLANQLRKSPAAIAEELAAANISVPYVKSFNPAGPYLNIKLDAPAFIKEIYSSVQRQKESFGRMPKGQGKKTMIEYSAPNSNKPQHLGHIRNNVLGMAVSNLLEASGTEVVRVNLINDRGIHICKSMLAYERWGNEDSPDKSGKKGDHFVGDYYVLFEQKVKDDLELPEAAQDMLQKWENGDKAVLDLWKKMNDWVYRGFDETYARLGCRFDKVFYESATYTKGREIVLHGLEKALLKRKTSGEIVVDLRSLELDEKVLLRKDGTSVYMTQDLGTTAAKFKEYDIDKSIFVVASEQNLHFKILFHVLNLLGYTWADKCFHLNYGMVYLPEGKLKSREGKVIDGDRGT